MDLEEKIKQIDRNMITILKMINVLVDACLSIPLHGHREVIENQLFNLKKWVNQNLDKTREGENENKSE